MSLQTLEPKAIVIPAVELRLPPKGIGDFSELTVLAEVIRVELRLPPKGIGDREDRSVQRQQGRSGA